MKMFFAFAVVMLSLTAICSTIDPREWTSVKGDKITASFISEKSGVVTLKTADGKTIAIKISALSDLDKQWVSESSYVPKNFEFHTTSTDGPLLRTSDNKRSRASFRDSITIITEIQGSFTLRTSGAFRKILISEIGFKELGCTLTNKYSKAINTDGRFVCVHWTVKNLSGNEDDINLPVLSIKKGGKFKAKDMDDYSNMMGTHCDGRERENLYEKISPQFSKKMCNIFEVPKDAEVDKIVFFELGYKPSYVYVSVKPDCEYDKLTTWQQKQKDLQ